MAFTQDKADAICERLAEGESLRSICRSDDMPAESTVRSWVVADVGGFAAQYARARDIGLDAIADEIVDIADTPMLGVKTKTDDTGKTETTEGDMIEHRRLRVDARKWYLSKLAPKKYGERRLNEHDIAPGGELSKLLGEMGRSTIPVQPDADS